MWGQPWKFQQARSMWAIKETEFRKARRVSAGQAGYFQQGSARGHAPCRLGKTGSFNEHGIYGQEKEGSFRNHVLYDKKKEGKFQKRRQYVWEKQRVSASTRKFDRGRESVSFSEHAIYRRGKERKFRKPRHRKTQVLTRLPPNLFEASLFLFCAAGSCCCIVDPGEKEREREREML